MTLKKLSKRSASIRSILLALVFMLKQLQLITGQCKQSQVALPPSAAKRKFARHSRPERTYRK